MGIEVGLGLVRGGVWVGFFWAVLGWVWGGGCVGIEVGGRGLEKGLIGVWFGARFGLGLRVLDYGLRLY